MADVDIWIQDGNLHIQDDNIGERVCARVKDVRRLLELELRMNLRDRLNELREKPMDLQEDPRNPALGLAQKAEIRALEWVLDLIQVDDPPEEREEGRQHRRAIQIRYDIENLLLSNKPIVTWRSTPPRRWEVRTLEGHLLGADPESPWHALVNVVTKKSDAE